MVLLFYTTISVDLANYEIFHAKVGKGGIIDNTCTFKVLELVLVQYVVYSHTVLDLVSTHAVKSTLWILMFFSYLWNQ